MSLDAYLLAAVAALVVALGTWGYIEHERAAVLSADNTILKANVKACTDANTTDQGTITTLKGANQKYADDASASSRAAVAAVLDAQTAKAQLARSRASLAAAAAIGAQVPACAAFLAVDLAQACPAVAAAVKGGAQ
jgi:hypothetical protein